MAISGVGATPEPEKSTQKSVNKQEEKHYSIFDNAPQDGTVSTDEQRTAFLDSVNKDNTLIIACKQLKVNITDFFNNFAGNFRAINTDGSQESAENTNKLVKLRILKYSSELSETLLKKYKGEEKQPPSITTEKGLTSEECMDYFVGKIVNMGLDFDAETFADVFARYDYDLSGDDSIISTNELYNESYTSKFMNHDFEGNIKDTHALDYLANVYAAALKNK